MVQTNEGTRDPVECLKLQITTLYHQNSYPQDVTLEHYNDRLLKGVPYIILYVSCNRNSPYKASIFLMGGGVGGERGGRDEVIIHVEHICQQRLGRLLLQVELLHLVLKCGVVTISIDVGKNND